MRRGDILDLGDGLHVSESLAKMTALWHSAAVGHEPGTHAVKGSALVAAPEDLQPAMLGDQSPALVERRVAVIIRAVHGGF